MSSIAISIFIGAQGASAIQVGRSVIDQMARWREDDINQAYLKEQADKADKEDTLSLLADLTVAKINQACLEKKKAEQAAKHDQEAKARSKEAEINAAKPDDKEAEHSLMFRLFEAGVKAIDTQPNPENWPHWKLHAI